MLSNYTFSNIEQYTLKMFINASQKLACDIILLVLNDGDRDA